MKFVPRSIIGWFFIIFLTSGLIINSSSTGIIDYILMFLFSYTVVIIFSNIFSSDNSKIRNNTPIKNATSSEEDKLSKHLAQLEEVERIKNLKDDIKSKRESLGLISMEHYEALLKKIKSQQKLIKTINEQINSYTSDKNFSLRALLVFIPAYFLILYYQFSIFDTPRFNTSILFTIVGCTLLGYFIFMRYRKFKNLLFEAQEKIKIETLVLKDLKIEKKKNQLD
jgi:hypothetical protein